MKIKLDKGAIMPTYAHEDDAGMDLYTPVNVTVYPGERVGIITGVHVQIPHGMYGKLESKSGLNIKYGVVSCGGVIDCGYTGPIIVELYNFDSEPYRFKAGDKIVQLIIQPYKHETLELVEQLDSSDRGDNGIGSTGK